MRFGKTAMINLVAAELCDNILHLPSICFFRERGDQTNGEVSSSNSVLTYAQPNQKIKPEEGQELGQMWKYKTCGFVEPVKSPLTPGNTSHLQGRPSPLAMLFSLL